MEGRKEQESARPTKYVGTLLDGEENLQFKQKLLLDGVTSRWALRQLVRLYIAGKVALPSAKSYD